MSPVFSATPASEIGPPGTTSVRGRARFYLFIGGLIVVPFVLLFVAIIVMVMVMG